MTLISLKVDIIRDFIFNEFSIERMIYREELRYNVNNTLDDRYWTWNVCVYIYIVYITILSRNRYYTGFYRKVLLLNFEECSRFHY